MFGELQQFYVCLSVGTEGVLRTLQLSGKCRGISQCLESGHSVCYVSLCNFNSFHMTMQSVSTYIFIPLYTCSTL